jgi:hypothetical protein
MSVLNLNVYPFSEKIPHVVVGKTPLLICPERLAAIPNKPGLIDFAVTDCSEVDRARSNFRLWLAY